jgi:hypothetical protein
MSKPIRPLQLALHIPGTDDELDNALGYNLDKWHQEFVSAAARGETGAAAVRAADAACGRAPRTAEGARWRAWALTNGKAKHSNDVALAIENQRTRAGVRLGFSLEEFYADTRALGLVGAGMERIRKTFARRDEDGTLVLEDAWVYEPSLTALAKAAELKGRHLGAFDDRLAVSGAPTQEQALDELE